MTFWLYLLRYADDSYDAAHTDKLELRLAQPRLLFSL